MLLPSSSLDCQIIERPHQHLPFPQAAGKAKDFESLLNEVETAQLEGSALDKACNQLQELVAQLQPAAGLLKDAGQQQGR